MRDLAIVLADQDTSAVVTALVTKRWQSLGTRPIAFDPRQDILRNAAGKDAGCYHEGAALLGPYRRTHKHGLVILDEAWGGTPGRDVIQKKVKASLVNDWGDDAEVIVIAPELEVWAFVPSEHLSSALRWPEKNGPLRAWLEARGDWHAGHEKPHDPKKAIHKCAQQGGVRITPRWFEELSGGKLGLGRCTDSAFQNLVATLRRWFPAI